MQRHSHHYHKQNCSPSDEKYVETAGGSWGIQGVHQHDSRHRSNIKKC